MYKGIIIVASILLVAMGLLPSCKSGCTDPKALNYDHTAKSDNGMCLYCDTGTFQQTLTVTVRDEDSAFNSFPAADMTFNQVALAQKGNGCKSLGLHTGQGCDIHLSMRNLTNKHMQGSYNITFFNSQGENSWFSNSSFQTINPNGLLDIGSISNGCDSIGSGTINITLNNMSYTN